jgi:enamine deaminase RidA (YjgF/YER057c/UK114 family)
MITDRLDPPGILKIPEIVNVSVATGSRIIHVSGQVAVDADGKVVGTTHLEQTRKALENLLIALRSAGATLEDVGKFTIYVVNYSWDALEGIMTATKEVCGDSYPRTANTLVGVASLWLPDLLVEIEAVAVI